MVKHGFEKMMVSSYDWSKKECFKTILIVFKQFNTSFATNFQFGFVVQFGPSQNLRTKVKFELNLITHQTPLTTVKVVLCKLEEWNFDI